MGNTANVSHDDHGTTENDAVHTDDRSNTNVDNADTNCDACANGGADSTDTPVWTATSEACVKMVGSAEISITGQTTIMTSTNANQSHGNTDMPNNDKAEQHSILRLNVLLLVTVLLLARVHG